MNSNCKYLFIYGTLLDTDNDFGLYLRNNSVWVAKGSFTGLLYNMGEYPGAIYKTGVSNKVYGDIVELKNAASVLKLLDEYEGVGESEAQPNLYTRDIIPVATATGMIDCWVYLYNLPVDGLPLIASGKYKA